MNRFSSLGCLIVLTAGVSAAASYYVTQSGSGTSDGKSAANAMSVSKYNSSSAPTGGDTVYFSGTITSTVSVGTSGTGNGASRLTLDFTGATLNTASPRIRIAGENFLNLLGGTLGTASDGYLIDFNGNVSHDVTVSGWTFNGPDNSLVTFVAGKACQNTVFQNNTINNVESFIFGDTTNMHDIHISNNYIRGSANTEDQTDMIRIGDAYNMTIEGNWIIQRAPGATSGRHNDIIQTFQSGATPNAAPYGWVIRYNRFELAVPSGSGDTSWFMMENLTDRNGVEAVKIYGNVFIGDLSDEASNNGIVNDGNGFTTRFYNNTVIRHNGPDNTIRFLNAMGPGTTYAENNAGAADSGTCCTFLSWTTTLKTVNYNFFYRFGGCSSTHTGPNGSCSIDPKFVDYANDNYALQSGSPLIGKGDSGIGSEYSQGIAVGATWPNPKLVTRPAGAWDVGAYQSGGSTAPGNGNSGSGGTTQVTPPGTVTATVK